MNPVDPLLHMLVRADDGRCTIERMMTHGRLRDFTISTAREVLPEPLLPATPMMLMSCHGGA